MSETSLRSFSPLRPEARPIGWRGAAVLIGAALLAASSFAELPMVPVPMTMQTFAVFVIGALYGWRLGGLTILVWLAAGAAGLPVLADGTSGIDRFTGATGGYLIAFPIAGALTGLLAERGWNGERPVHALAAMILAHAICLALGAAWLSTKIGLDRAIEHGVLPFIAGGLVKSALAVAVLMLLARRSSGDRSAGRR
ncbi:biotin transporter BioY [Tistrella mobilis]|uniref:biotin transporter BioY n=1 Tax=Tistrella mobilis TaxID=171437 RepID=UPI0031F68636